MNERFIEAVAQLLDSEPIAETHDEHLVTTVGQPPDREWEASQNIAQILKRFESDNEAIAVIFNALRYYAPNETSRTRTALGGMVVALCRE